MASSPISDDIVKQSSYDALAPWTGNTQIVGSLSRKLSRVSTATPKGGDEIYFWHVLFGPLFKYKQRKNKHRCNAI